MSFYTGLLKFSSVFSEDVQIKFILVRLVFGLKWHLNSPVVVELDEKFPRVCEWFELGAAVTGWPVLNIFIKLSSWTISSRLDSWRHPILCSNSSFLCLSERSSWTKLGLLGPPGTPRAPGMNWPDADIMPPACIPPAAAAAMLLIRLVSSRSSLSRAISRMMSL